MADIYASGTEVIGTGGANFGKVTVKCVGLEPGFQIVATARPSGAGGPPIGLGPLFCAFVKRNDVIEPGAKKPTNPANDFDILVYDIQAHAFPTEITVDWVVVKP